MARPQLPYGYSICAYTPANVNPTGGTVGVLETSYPDWDVREYLGDDDDFLYYRFIAKDGSDSFWAWPDEVDCSSTGSSKPATGATTAAKVKDIQKALNFHYQDHPYFPLAVDGKFGPKTCFAAYAFQKKAVNYGGGTLIGKFFTTLGLPEVWTTHFKNSCLSWYQDTAAPITIPEDEGTPLPWKHILVGAAGGSLIGLAGKKTFLKKSAVKTWHAGVGGAVLGALGGFLAGKVRGA